MPKRDQEIVLAQIRAKEIEVRKRFKPDMPKEAWDEVKRVITSLVILGKECTIDEIQAMLFQHRQWDRYVNVNPASEELADGMKSLWKTLELEFGLTDGYITNRLALVMPKLADEHLTTKPLDDPEFQRHIRTLLFGLRWLEYGLHTISISPKWEAAAMCTRPVDDVLKDLRLPWPAFVIQLPKDTMLTVHTSKGVFPAKIISVWTTDNDKWYMQLHTDHKGSLYAKLIKEELGKDDLFKREPNQIQVQLACRVVVSIICAITDKANMTNINKENHQAYRNWNKRKGPYPKVMRYQITEPVTVDLRPHMHSYLHGTGKKLDIQFVVTGHRKWQPYGPRHSLRKRIWIQPYWKGPTDAPIAVRPHILPDQAPPTEEV